MKKNSFPSGKENIISISSYLHAVITQCNDCVDHVIQRYRAADLESVLTV